MDVSTIISVAGFAIVACALIILIKQYKPEYALLISICAGVIIFILALKNISPAIMALQNLVKKAQISNEYVKAIFKTLLVCYITQLASDSCIDAGQAGIASKVNLCGKVFILIISLPLFENLVEIAMKLINY